MRCVRKSSCRRIHSFYLSSQKDRGSSLRWGGDYRKIRFQGEDEFSFGHVKFEISVRHKSEDVRIDSWDMRVWELTEEV